MVLQILFVCKQRNTGFQIAFWRAGINSDALESSGYTGRRIDQPTSVHKQHRPIYTTICAHDGKLTRSALLHENHVKKKMCVEKGNRWLYMHLVVSKAGANLVPDREAHR